MYRIMVIDDREIFRRQIKRIPFFKKNHHFCVNYEAKNGAEAFEILKSNQVDVVITDIKMPKMDGLELLKKIKEEDLCECVILLSEYTDFTYAKQGLVLGAFDFIVKPIDADQITELMKRVKEFLDNLKQEQVYTEKEIKMLNALLLKNDPYSVEIAMQFFKRIKKSKSDNSVEMNIELEKLLGQIRENMEQNKSWISNYVDLEDVFSFNQNVDVIQMEKQFREKAEEVLYEVNKLNANSRNQLIQNTCNYILSNIEEDDTNLKTIAENYYVNKTYLSHIFKIEMGMSFVDYVTFAKMERAKIILKKTDVKIYELAEMLGYRDSEYFGRLFKKSIGMNANSYKKYINES